MRNRKGRPGTESQTQKTLHFVVTQAEEEAIRQRAKEMDMNLVEYLRFVSIPKD